LGCNAILGIDRRQDLTLPVHRWIGVNVYRKSTDSAPATVQRRGFCGISSLRGDYHQQYLAKNPDGYCGVGGCGVPFKVAELQVGEKA
jgi:hypothetical protein